MLICYMHLYLVNLTNFLILVRLYVYGPTKSILKKYAYGPNTQTVWNIYTQWLIVKNNALIYSSMFTNQANSDFFSLGILVLWKDKSFSSMFCQLNGEYRNELFSHLYWYLVINKSILIVTLFKLMNPGLISKVT